MENQALAERIRAAYERADLATIEDLLDPGCTWGAPGDPNPTCQSKGDVIRWYRAATDLGMRADVVEAFGVGDSVVLGLNVTGAEDSTGQERWQALKVRDGLIVDIAGFDTRDDAARFATTGELPPTWA